MNYLYDWNNVNWFENMRKALIFHAIIKSYSSLKTISVKLIEHEILMENFSCINFSYPEY